MSTEKRTHHVSTREDKFNAVEHIKKTLKQNGVLLRDAQVLKRNGVSRAVSRLVNAKIITINAKTGEATWATDWSTSEIIDLCWTQHGKGDDKTKGLPTHRTEVQGPDAKSAVGVVIKLDFEGAAHTKLVERIDAALNMVEQYKIENRAPFIADYLIKTNPSV